jgi:hypothetical protein
MVAFKRPAGREKFIITEKNWCQKGRTISRHMLDGIDARQRSGERKSPLPRSEGGWY